MNWNWRRHCGPSPTASQQSTFHKTLALEFILQSPSHWNFAQILIPLKLNWHLRISWVFFFPDFKLEIWIQRGYLVYQTNLGLNFVLLWPQANSSTFLTLSHPIYKMGMLMDTSKRLVRLKNTCKSTCSPGRVPEVVVLLFWNTGAVLEDKRKKKRKTFSLS